jgi:small subunit ribosomal protein S6e
VLLTEALVKALKFSAGGVRMVEFKLVIGDPKTGKCLQKTVSDKSASTFMGLKIGDNIKGEAVDLTGYEFKITGGSDFCGFPMRKGIGGIRKKIFIGEGVGFRGSDFQGLRTKKTVCGDTITEKTSQINLKVLKYGKKPLIEEKKEGSETAEAQKAGEE